MLVIVFLRFLVLTKLCQWWQSEPRWSIQWPQNRQFAYVGIEAFSAKMWPSRALYIWVNGDPDGGHACTRRSSWHYSQLRIWWEFQVGSKNGLAKGGEYLSWTSQRGLIICSHDMTLRLCHLLLNLFLAVRNHLINWFLYHDPSNRSSFTQFISRCAQSPH